MKPEQLKAIEERWAKATAGKRLQYKSQIVAQQDGWKKVICEMGIATVDDAECIISAPTDIAALLAEVRRLQCCGNCRQQVGNPYRGKL